MTFTQLFERQKSNLCKLLKRMRWWASYQLDKRGAEAEECQLELLDA